VTVDQDSASEAPASQQRTTLPVLLAGWAATLGDLPAFTVPGHRGESDGVSTYWSWRDLDAQVNRVAAMLAGRLNPDERVALLASQGLEYLVGFLGALRAGVIAVPLFTPGLPEDTGRLRTVLGRCRPSLALTTRAEQRAVTEFVGPYLAVIAIEDIPAAAPRDWPEPDPHSPAYLRYSSGSARAPAGVMVTHADLVASAVGDGPDAVNWPPLFRDLGLVLSTAGELS